MADITITQEEDGPKGRYVAAVAGSEDQGIMTYSRASPTLIIVDHTEVPDSLRGKGVGAALAANVVAEAREKGFRIIPLCPFLAGQVQRHPEWADVITR